MRIPVPVRKRLFVEALEKTGNVSEACRTVHWSRGTAYGWRGVDGDFAKAWEEAVTVAVHELEQEALRRVTRSYPPSKMSSPMIERLLKLHRPERYSKHAHT